MSMVFGRQKDAVSKSWSDMWEEDVEEDEQELARQLEALKNLNSRTWSQESKPDATPTQIGQATVVQESAQDDDKTAVATSPVIDTFSDDIDGDLVADGFFFHESSVPEQLDHDLPRYSPPSKRSVLDKWAELGERRRAFTGSSESKSPDSPKSKRPFGFAFNGSYALGTGLWDNSNQHKRDRTIAGGCPWNKSRDWNNPWRREKRHGFGDEWVGHWQDARVI